MGIFYIEGSEPKLCYDEDDGEGTIRLPKTWHKTAREWRRDVLADWIEQLQELRESIP
jgi:hypothetical protein